MSVKRASIAQLMAIVALFGMNLGAGCALPLEAVMFPALWVFLGCIDLLILWKLILPRSLRAFHYTFLIVFVIAWFVMANFVATERFQPLSFLVQWCQQKYGVSINGISRGFLRVGEFWMACFLCFTLAVVIGLVAAWFERRRNWDIAAFFRGALVGFGLANLLAILDGAIWGWVMISPARMIGRLVLVGFCLILGGWVGLSRLKSNTLGRNGRCG